MKLSARNQLPGRVREIHKGATTAHVENEVGGAILTASITNEAVEALKLLEVQAGAPKGASIDVVLMDVRMPHMSGIEACRRIKADRRFSKNLTGQWSYVMSKLLTDSDTYYANSATAAEDQYNRRLEKSIGQMIRLNGSDEVT